jgi:hypothetical protein
MSGSSQLIQRCRRAQRQVPILRRFRFESIGPDISQNEMKSQESQALGASAAAALSGTCRVAGFWLRSTLRYASH